MTNENDDWEIAVDTGEFDRRLEQQTKDRLATQVMTSNDSIKSNKPIRILKRPTSQSQLSVSNDLKNSSQIVTNPFVNDNSSSTIESSISIIPPSSTIKTYEQREQEYRQARLRILGEEESSVKDDDDDPLPLDELATQSNPSPNAIYFNTNGPYSQSQFHPPYLPMPCPRYPPVGFFDYSANSWYPYPQQYDPPQ